MLSQLKLPLLHPLLLLRQLKPGFVRYPPLRLQQHPPGNKEQPKGCRQQAEIAKRPG
jgi:hypothetical protein